MIALKKPRFDGGSGMPEGRGLKVKNPAAHAALRRFCEDALRHIDGSVVAPRKIPTIKTLGSVEFSDGQLLRYETVPEVDWAQLSRNLLGDPASISSWGEALAAVKADARLAGRGVPLEQPEATIVGLLLRLVKEQGGTEFREDPFDRVYRETEDYFYRETVQYQYLAPLERFRMDAEEVPLGAGLSIRRVPEEWRRVMLQESIESSAIADDMRLLVHIDFGIVLFLEVDKQNTEESAPRCARTGLDAMDLVFGRLWEVRAALRLFRAGGVEYDWILAKPTSWVPTITRRFGRAGARAFGGGWYQLTKQDASRFREFWSLYCASRARRDQTLDLAVGRFTRAYGRALAEERLVDLMIAFEALLLDNEQELRYKLAMRGAALLGEDGDQRQTIRDELAAAYKQRNKIVHGGRADQQVKIGDEDAVSLTDLNSRVEDRLRAAIRKLMELDPTRGKTEMVKELDLQIARGFEPKGKAKRHVHGA